MTRSELESYLTQKLAPYFIETDVKVNIRTGGKKVYYVMGEVQREGPFPYSGDLTLFEAVMQAAPKEHGANLARVRLIRADPRDPQILIINLSEMIDTGDSTFNVLIHERDIIYVPPTMLAQLGYFIDSALFPIKLVLTSLSGAIFSLGRLQFYQDRGFF